MEQSLLFIPDISGFTQFVQNTEQAHSQHVIAELLEVLVDANIDELELAEVEGDALFFFKTNTLPSQERLLAQFERMFAAFYSHLEKLEKNRICPCNACATANQLDLKIVAHCGPLQFLEVQDRRKPFGQAVIEAHRLLKNSIDSDHYALISKDLTGHLGLSTAYRSKLYHFEEGTDTYDDKNIDYLFSKINRKHLSLDTNRPAVYFDPPCEASFSHTIEINAQAASVLELITNYSNRHLWVSGVDKFEFNPNEVTRLDTKHICVIDGKHYNFTTVGLSNPKHQYVYGELSEDAPFINKFYQFYLLNSTSLNSCKLTIEGYIQTRNPLKKLMVALFAKSALSKSSLKAITALQALVNTTAATLQ